ncbi:hypothetical protein OGAPHI_005860 [Ogataea philodendri]|uniref:Uncharacterized protein n=1 Tax=Ogataea philodendri TaxID=1378263 RepID=A0A9P8NZ68_9ASCO|nr:uncharacterized protein OGAPHI_005860 [Ogataea philodendri]KAH3662608.1 hypothetical protein OGAPHI_005860 [Ogataea philodendri]
MLDLLWWPVLDDFRLANRDLMLSPVLCGAVFLMKSTELLILLWWFGESSTTSSLVIPLMMFSVCDNDPDGCEYIWNDAADMLSGRDLEDGRRVGFLMSGVDLLFGCPKSLDRSILANGSYELMLFVHRNRTTGHAWSLGRIWGVELVGRRRLCLQIRCLSPDNKTFSILISLWINGGFKACMFATPSVISPMIWRISGSLSLLTNLEFMKSINPLPEQYSINKKTSYPEPLLILAAWESM